MALNPSRAELTLVLGEEEEEEEEKRFPTELVVAVGIVGAAVALIAATRKKK